MDWWSNIFKFYNSYNLFIYSLTRWIINAMENYDVITFLKSAWQYCNIYMQDHWQEIVPYWQLPSATDVHQWPSKPITMPWLGYSWILDMKFMERIMSLKWTYVPYEIKTKCYKKRFVVVSHPFNIIADIQISST